jgi:transcription initiation factor TFIIH subunit 2
LSRAAHKAAAEARIRVSVVGLSAELYVLKYMCDCCEGTYTVASDGLEHLKQLLHMHIPGPPSDKEQPTVAPFIQMGFPSKLRSSLPM